MTNVIKSWRRQFPHLRSMTIPFPRNRTPFAKIAQRKRKKYIGSRFCPQKKRTTVFPSLLSTEIFISCPHKNDACRIFCIIPKCLTLARKELSAAPHDFSLAFILRPWSHSWTELSKISMLLDGENAERGDFAFHNILSCIIQ